MIEPRYSDFFDKPQIIYPKGLKKLFDVHYWPLAYSRIEMFIYLHYVAKGAINIEPFISGDQRYILGEDYLPYGISKNEYGDEFRDVNQTRIDLIELWRKLDPNGECLEWEKAYNPSFFDSNWPILDNGLEKSEIEDMSNLFISFFKLILFIDI